MSYCLCYRPVLCDRASVQAPNEELCVSTADCGHLDHICVHIPATGHVPEGQYFSLRRYDIPSVNVCAGSYDSQGTGMCQFGMCHMLNGRFRVVGLLHFFIQNKNNKMEQELAAQHADGVCQITK